jgi:hypothetical protein
MEQRLLTQAEVNVNVFFSFKINKLSYIIFKKTQKIKLKIIPDDFFSII